MGLFINRVAFRLCKLQGTSVLLNTDNVRLKEQLLAPGKPVGGQGLINTYLSSLRLERVGSAGASLRPCQGQLLS